jgi:hypothetical protein
VIEDRQRWQAIRGDGMTRFVVMRALALGLFAGLSHVVQQWGKPSGVDWGSALLWLGGGLLGGVVWALISWRMSDQAFNRNG